MFAHAVTTHTRPNRPTHITEAIAWAGWKRRPLIQSCRIGLHFPAAVLFTQSLSGPAFSISWPGPHQRACRLRQVSIRDGLAVLAVCWAGRVALCNTDATVNAGLAGRPCDRSIQQVSGGSRPNSPTEYLDAGWRSTGCSSVHIHYIQLADCRLPTNHRQSGIVSRNKLTDLNSTKIHQKIRWISGKNAGIRQIRIQTPSYT